ncbi:MAG: glycosyltransferase family 2 protein [Candidatus Omnitrophica bacterium]|nr:glycosyltransferase family 2 protein [Candidatus Omnitrophota bacterium]
MQLLSVIIPVYNEERTIEQVLQKVIDAPLPQGVLLEVIIVDDGSKDDTAGHLHAFHSDPKVRIFHQVNQGKTAALLKGIKEARGDIFLIQDSDLEYDPEQYPQLLNPILNNSASVVYGSRFLGHIDGMKIVNRLANLISNWTLSLLYGACITDVNTCYKVFRREAFAGVEITSRNFAFETEITVKFLKKKLQIIEVPIRYSARTRGQGKKINWLTALEMYWPIIKFRFWS